MPVTRDDELDAALDAMLTGDEASFSAVYRAVHPALLRYLGAMVGQDAADVAAETWLSVTKDQRTFHGDLDGFRGWVMRIGRNRAIDHLRAQQRRPILPIDAAGEVPDREDVESLVLGDLDTARAIELIGMLPADQAEAVALRVIVGLDAAEAGAVLGKRAGAVRVAAHRGLKRLAAVLAEQQGRAVPVAVAGAAVDGIVAPRLPGSGEALPVVGELS